MAPPRPPGGRRQGLRDRGGAPAAGLRAGHQPLPRLQLPEPRLLLLAARRGPRAEGDPVGRGDARPALEAAAAHRPAGGQRAGPADLPRRARRAAAASRSRSSSACPTTRASPSPRAASSSCSAARCCGFAAAARTAGRSSRSGRCRSARSGPTRSPASPTRWSATPAPAGGPQKSTPPPRYSVAVLHDPKEQLPPSNRRALERFVRAGSSARRRRRADHPRRLRPAAGVRRPVHPRDDGARPPHLPLRPQGGERGAGRDRRSGVDPEVHQQDLPRRTAPGERRAGAADADPRPPADRPDRARARLPGGAQDPRRLLLARRLQGREPRRARRDPRRACSTTPTWSSPRSSCRPRSTGGSACSTASRSTSASTSWPATTGRSSSTAAQKGPQAGGVKTWAVEDAPADVVDIATRAAEPDRRRALRRRPQGDRPTASSSSRSTTIPTSTPGVEDAVLKDDLYRLVMQDLVRRIEHRTQPPDAGAQRRRDVSRKRRRPSRKARATSLDCAAGRPVERSAGAAAGEKIARRSRAGGEARSG